MTGSEQRRTDVRKYLLCTHRDLLTAVLACADTVLDCRSADGIPLDVNLGDQLCEQLDRAGIIEQLPAVLTGAVNAMDASPPVEPVGAPPYVVIANTGPIMRATLDTRRLVITIEAFRVHNDTRQYVRTTSDPDEALSVDIRNQG
jgi:hypothetical protein